MFDPQYFAPFNTNTAKTNKILPNFLVWKFSGNCVFPGGITIFYAVRILQIIQMNENYGEKWVITEITAQHKLFPFLSI